MLNSYRALDLTDDKGYVCGKILADLGMDVIKIEPPAGDPGRKIGPFFQDIAHLEQSLYWFAHNTNKRSITLNLESAQGRELFKKLVETVDIVIESFQPGYMDSLGLGYSELSQINIGLIMTSITPFGQTGPYCNHKGSDMVVWAMGGLMNQTGDADRRPVQVSVPQSFIAASTYAAEGTLIALFAKRIIGEGQHVDVSAMETVAFLGMEAFPFWFVLGQNMGRSGSAISRMGINAPVIWLCKDGYINYILQMGLPGADRNIKMAKWLEEEGLSSDFIRETDWHKMDFMELAKGGIERLTEPLSKLFMTYTRRELFNESLRRDITLYPVSDSKDTLENEQLLARGFWVELAHPEISQKITYPGPFAVFSETPIKMRHCSPLIGEHNEEIYLKEMGFSEDDIVSMSKAGVI